MARPASLRYVRFTEEVAFGQPSPLNSHPAAYGNLSLRKSLPTGNPGEKGHGGVRRNVQLTGPIARDGRFAVVPDIALPDIHYPGDAQRAFFDTLLKRKFTPVGIHHPRTSLGDMRSFSIDAVGNNPAESRDIRGCKSLGFNVTSQRRGIINILRIAAQYSASVDVDSAWDGNAPENKIYIRNQPGFHHIESSAFRVRKVSEGPIADDPGGTLISIPTSLSINCTRSRIPRAQLGATLVDGSGIAQEREEKIEGEEWVIRMSMETDQDTVAQALVSDMRQNSVSSRRYNLRFDLGLNNGILYVERPWADTEAIVPALWGFDENRLGDVDPAHPEYLARIYGCYACDAGLLQHFQYAPLPGDTIRHQGYRGPQDAQSLSPDGTFVATVGRSKVIGTYHGPRLLPIGLGGGVIGVNVGFPVSANNTVVLPGGSHVLAPPRVQLFPPDPFPHPGDSGWPLPDYLVSWYTTDAMVPSYTTDLPLDYEEQWVPGGIVFDFENVTLIGSEGLSNSESSHQFSFEADLRSTVSVKY